MATFRDSLMMFLPWVKEQRDEERLTFTEYLLCWAVGSGDSKTHNKQPLPSRAEQTFKHSSVQLAQDPREMGDGGSSLLLSLYYVPGIVLGPLYSGCCVYSSQ